MPNAAPSRRPQFVAWLAAQSDASLAGHDLERKWLRGDQRLSRERLRAFVKVA